MDLDFGKQDRNKVLQHVINEYGQDNVASLGLFQYIWAKGAIKDIGRVLGIPFEVTNEMTSRLDKESIKEVIELGLLDKYKEEYPELFDYAERLAGLPKSFSAHPCGKIAANNPIIYYNAIDINENGEVILQGDMHTADDLGLIKADFLGLRTVDVIYDTLEMIGKDYEYIAPHNLNFEDKKIFDNFRNGYTAGVFQFESPGMRDTLKKIECSSIEDLIISNALFRPGSIKYIDNYANRKKGIEQFEYLHNDLKPILQNTFGIIVFQEQLIEIGRMAGLSNPDELRKATAKKKANLLDKIKPELFEGLTNRGWSNEQLNTLWEMMLDFASYSFNRSHSAAYAIIAYICMFLKTYHPKEFLCAWTNSVSKKTEKVAECVEEINRLQIPIYLGKYNDCSSDCKVYKDGIMMGIKTIKYCNSELASELMSLPKVSSFIEMLDNISKTSVNARQLNALIGLNFFSDFGNNKKLLHIVDLYNGIKVKPKGAKSPKTILPALRTCNQIKKDKIPQYEKYGVTEYIIEKYSDKETPKQYSQIDNKGMLNELTSCIPDDSLSAINQVKFDMEYLEYTTYKNENFSDDYYIVSYYKTYKDETKPSFTLRNLNSGNEIKTRIKQSKIYKQNPFGQFSVLQVFKLTPYPKKKLINGKWQNSGEEELILENYDVLG